MERGPFVVDLIGAQDFGPIDLSTTAEWHVDNERVVATTSGRTDVEEGRTVLARLAMLRTWLMVSAEERVRDERGASLIEYALLLALIAVVAITALRFLGSTTVHSLNNAANDLANSH